MAPLSGQIPFSSAFPKINTFHLGQVQSQRWVLEWEKSFSWLLVLCFPSLPALLCRNQEGVSQLGRDSPDFPAASSWVVIPETSLEMENSRTSSGHC